MLISAIVIVSISLFVTVHLHAMGAQTYCEHLPGVDCPPEHDSVTADTDSVTPEPDGCRKCSYGCNKECFLPW